MEIIQYVKSHWSIIDLVFLPGALLGYQTVLMNALEAHGYTKAESWCKKVGNFLSFLTDLVGGILSKKQNSVVYTKTIVLSDVNQAPTAPSQKVD